MMFYVQHLLGIGHLARASRVAEGLAAAGIDVTLVTGGGPVPGFPAPGIAHVALPAILSGNARFSSLVDAEGNTVDDAFKARRRDRLLATFEALRPEVVMIEAFPFGRRQVRFELLPLLERIEVTTPRPLVLTSVRDILQTRSKPGRDEETVALVNNHFDRVLVHGDPDFVRLEETFPLAKKFAAKILYTGFVAPPPPQPPAEVFDVVVSAGGGAVGATLVHAAAEAANDFPGTRWCLITGPNLPKADFEALGRIAGPGVQIERFRTDFTSLLSAARLSVSQAGYNTLGDILVAGCRCLLIPFTAGGETEQAFRARRLADRGLAGWLDEADVTPQSMSAKVAASLSASRPPPHGLALDGVRQTAALVSELAAHVGG